MAPPLQLDRSEVSRSHPAESPAPAEVSRARGWHAWLPAASLDHPRAVTMGGDPPCPPARGHPCGRPGDAATPTRSTRTPLVMRPLQCRLETPTLPDVTGGNPRTAVGLCHGCDPTHPARGRATPSRSHHASSTPAKGEDLRARSTHALTGEPSDGPPESAPRLRMGTPARRIRSQGPHHLPHREEEQDPLHPRCLPSVRPAGPEETPRPLAFAGHRRREQAPFRSSHPASRW
jgi:hypothetical protein